MEYNSRICIHVPKNESLCALLMRPTVYMNSTYPHSSHQNRLMLPHQYTLRHFWVVMLIYLLDSSVNNSSGKLTQAPLNLDFVLMLDKMEIIKWTRNGKHAAAIWQFNSNIQIENEDRMSDVKSDDLLSPTCP